MRVFPVALAALLFLPAVVAAPYTRTFEYAGSAPLDALGDCERLAYNELLREFFGGGGVIPEQPWSVCVPLTPGATQAELRLNDISTMRVAGYYRFFDREWDALGDATYCRTTSVSIPPTSYFVELAPLAPALGAGACNLSPSNVTTATPTYGTIVLTQT